MLTRSKINSIKRKISKALKNNEISHKKLMTIVTEEKKIGDLNKSIRITNSQRSDIENNNLIEESKKVGIHEVIKRNEIINNSIKP